MGENVVVQSLTLGDLFNNVDLYELNNFESLERIDKFLSVLKFATDRNGIEVPTENLRNLSYTKTLFHRLLIR
jgi:hypothetical protein